MTSSAIVGLNAFSDSFNLPINGLGGLLWKVYAHHFLGYHLENTRTIQSRHLHHLELLRFLVNKTMHIYANTLPVNHFTYFKIQLKVIKCVKSFIM